MAQARPSTPVAVKATLSLVRYMPAISVGAVPFLLPLLLQVGFGMSAAQSGMITFASAGGSMFIKAAAPAILRRYGFKLVLMFCGAGSGLLLAVNGLYTIETPHWVIFSVLFLSGFFRPASLRFEQIHQTPDHYNSQKQQQHTKTEIHGIHQAIDEGLLFCLADEQALHCILGQKGYRVHSLMQTPDPVH